MGINLGVFDDSVRSVILSGVILNGEELALQLHLEAPDPEAIILALYEKYGVDGFARISGPYALALRDARRNSLILARDPFGQCELYWGVLQGRPVFSDSLAQVADAVGREPEPQAWRDYLSLGYILPPFTRYKNIFRVAAGEAVEFAADGRESSRVFWRPALNPQELSFADAVDMMREKLDAAIRRVARVSPNPVLLLSGGVDSNVLLALMAQNGQVPECLTVGFGEDRYDERAAAAQTAGLFGAPHHCILGTPGDMPAIRARLKEREELFGDSSTLPNVRAFEWAKGRDIITGSGGDEIFGGYRRYRLMALREKLGRAGTAALSKILRAALGLFRDGEQRGAVTSLKRLSASFGMSPLAGYCSYQQLFSDDEIRRLAPWCMEGTRGFLERMEELFDALEGSLATRVNLLDIQTYLPDDGCLKLILSASGQNAYSPILDMDVVNAALTLPQRFRATITRNKPVLKAIGAPYLPKTLLAKGKRGFGIPVDAWFRTGPVPEIPDCYKREEVNRLLAEHRRGIAANGAKLWALTMGDRD